MARPEHGGNLANTADQEASGFGDAGSLLEERSDFFATLLTDLDIIKSREFHTGIVMYPISITLNISAAAVLEPTGERTCERSR